MVGTVFPHFITWLHDCTAQEKKKLLLNHTITVEWKKKSWNKIKNLWRKKSPVFPPVSGSLSTELFTDMGSHLVFVTLFGYQQAFTGLTDIARPFKSRRTSPRKRISELEVPGYWHSHCTAGCIHTWAGKSVSLVESTRKKYQVETTYWFTWPV